MSATGFVIRDWGFVIGNGKSAHASHMPAGSRVCESPITNHGRSATPGRNA